MNAQKPNDGTADQDGDSWTPLIYALLSTEPLWAELPDPAPLFGEEFLQAVLQVASQDAR